MKNYRKIFIVIFILFTSVIYSQNNRRYERNKREREAMYRLSDMIEKEKITEQKAQKEILKVYYDTKDYVRSKRHLLTEEEKEMMDKLQNIVWNWVKEDIKPYHSYSDFLQHRLVVLFAYEDIIKKYLYILIDSDKEELIFVGAMQDYINQTK